MKLRRLAIERLPGIDRPFELQALGDGLNIIVGPNGIGKSRLCAVVRALLWRERGIEDGGLVASAVFEHHDASWRVVREGSHHCWQRDGLDVDPPALPGERLDGCFFLGLRNLLDDSDRAGRELASEIRRQMSGGFDLDATKRSFVDSVPARIGSKETKALSAAESEIRLAERRQVDVERRERELESLKARAAEARRALRRLAHYDTAIGLQRLRGDFAGQQRDLAELPEALANLDGKEIERLDKLEEALAGKRREREAADSALTAGGEAACSTRLTGPIDPALLDTWRRRAEKLAELERRLDRARENAAVAREIAGECRKALGGHTAFDADLVASSPLAIDDDFDLFAFLRESHQLRAERVALQERLNLLAAREFPDDAARRVELLKRAVEPLRAWLRAPDPSASASTATRWLSRAFLWVAVALAASGLAATLFVPSPVFGMLAVGAGLGLAAAGLLFRHQQGDERGAPDWRSIARQQFPDAIDAPASWSSEVVADRLRQLEDELARHDADQKRALYRVADRALLDQSLKSLDEQGTNLEARRRELAERLGLDALRPDADMVDLARALDASRAAQAEASGATSNVDQLEGQQKELLKPITAFLTACDEQSPTDAAAAKAGVHSLEERDRQLRAAEACVIREAERRRGLDRELEQLMTERAEVFRVAGSEVSDRTGLGRILGELVLYRELIRSRDDIASGIKRAEADLDAAGEATLALQSVTELGEERASLEKESKHLEDLNRQIGEIGERARNARAGHALEDAIAKKSAALGELRDRRDEALAAAAGVFLIDAVRHEHEASQMPRVLERARKRFATFTHHRYELNVSPIDGGSFVAVDAKSGAGLSLDKLSDGTRAQLILAARLAFAEEAEQGAELPFFLDEALDHSDPERFHAIARSLARMVADDGRQVFYLTNDPTDVDRFQSAFDDEGCDQLKTVDLGEIRGRAARVDGPARLRVPPLAAVPSPANENPESYGTALGVSPLDPRLSASSQHVYYLLRDDLSLLSELLLARIETVGQCRTLLKGGSALARDVVTGSEVGAQIDARIELLETFCVARREGRCEKVGRLDLQASGAVTEKYFDAVVEIAAELDGDAGRLLLALRERKDRRLSGYRSNSADDLERFFVEHGQIDDRPILGESRIVERAIGTPAANQLTPKIASELVHQWWTLVEQTT